MTSLGQLADHQHPLVVETAAGLTRGESTVRAKLERLFLYVRDEIRFGFPTGGDFVKASETIRRGVGQCNTKATLLLALLRRLPGDRAAQSPALHEQP